jgi:hypothetical protein
MEDSELADAINDLTRVTIALSGKFQSKADAVRRLSELGIPNARIGVILSIPSKDVSSYISRTKKEPKRGK